MRRGNPRRTRWALRFARPAAAILMVIPAVILPATPALSARSKPEPCPNVDGSVPHLEDLPGLNGNLEVPPPLGEQHHTYTYIHDQLAIPDVSEPTQEELDKVTGPKKSYRPPTREWLLYRWKAYKGPLPWSEWVKTAVIPIGNNAKGKAFENLVQRTLGLGKNRGWECQKPLKGGVSSRKYDFVYQVDGNTIAIEVKSGKPYENEQLAKDTKNLKLIPNLRIIYITAEEVSEGTLRKFQEAGIIHVRFPAEGRSLSSDGKPLSTPWSPNPATTRIMTPPGQKPASGPLTEAIADSPGTPEEAKEIARLQAEVAAEAGIDDPSELGPGGDTGGIDFTTLELRYIADPPDGKHGLQYAFSVKPLKEGQLSWGGLKFAQESSDAFFVWLALRPHRFWVNLHPDEPDRIIDPKLGRTDAGRILLEADLELKTTESKFIDPRTKTGRSFWNRYWPLQSLLDSSGRPPCLTYRLWIVPGQASVYETDNSLYILDAPLDVKMEWHAPPRSGLLANCKPIADKKALEEAYRAYILPKVKKEVNTAPEYTSLRRVYLSRVAAQWYRERSAKQATAFSPIIDSDDISPWTARTPWKPRDVFDRYVKSFEKGGSVVKITKKVSGGIMVYTLRLGGVDFTTSPREAVPRTYFEQTQPNLSAVVADSRDKTVLTDDAMWLGGVSATAPESSWKRIWAPVPVILIIVLVVLAVLLFAPLPRRRVHRSSGDAS